MKKNILVISAMMLGLAATGFAAESGEGRYNLVSGTCRVQLQGEDGGKITYKEQQMTDLFLIDTKTGEVKKYVVVKDEKTGQTIKESFESVSAAISDIRPDRKESKSKMEKPAGEWSAFVSDAKESAKDSEYISVEDLRSPRRVIIIMKKIGEAKFGADAEAVKCVDKALQIMKMSPQSPMAIRFTGGKEIKEGQREIEKYLDRQMSALCPVFKLKSEYIKKPGAVPQREIIIFAN